MSIGVLVVMLAVSVFLGSFLHGKGTGFLSALNFAGASLYFVTIIKVLIQ